MVDTMKRHSFGFLQDYMSAKGISLNRLQNGTFKNKYEVTVCLCEKAGEQVVHSTQHI